MRTTGKILSKVRSKITAQRMIKQNSASFISEFGLLHPVREIRVAVIIIIIGFAIA